MVKRLAEEARNADKIQNFAETDKKRKRQYSKSSDSSSSDERHKRKKNKKKDKKSKKERSKKKKDKKRSKQSSDAESVTSIKGMTKKEEDDGEEWVELTHEIREKQAQKAREEEAQIVGPQIPEFLVAKHKAEMAYLDFE